MASGRHQMIILEEIKIHWRASSGRSYELRTIGDNIRSVPSSFTEPNVTYPSELPPPIIAPGRGRKRKTFLVEEEAEEVEQEQEVEQEEVEQPGPSSAVARPRRQTASVLAQQKYEGIRGRLSSGSIDRDLEIKQSGITGAGLGVFSLRSFSIGEFITEYGGDLIDIKEASRRSNIYDEDPIKFGSFMQFFTVNGKKMCIDGTNGPVGSCGRIINHSRKTPNIKRVVDEFDGILRMYFVAIKEIPCGEEILYDYGETQRDAMKKFPWLKQS